MIDPFTGTTPIPLSMWALRLLAEVHDRVDDPPCSIVIGAALMLTGEGSFTLMVTLSVAVPPGPVTLIV